MDFLHYRCVLEAKFAFSIILIEDETSQCDRLIGLIHEYIYVKIFKPFLNSLNLVKNQITLILDLLYMYYSIGFEAENKVTLQANGFAFSPCNCHFYLYCVTVCVVYCTVWICILVGSTKQKREKKSCNFCFVHAFFMFCDFFIHRDI